MKEIEDGSVHLIITSPPYWQLKDYGVEEQIGFNDTYENYINSLNLVWKECYRVLDKGCRLCINVGDQFARAAYYGRYKVISIRTEIIKFCEAVGFDFMGAIIWQKKTTTNTSGGASLMGSYPFPRNGVLSIDYEFILLFKKLGVPKKPDKKSKELSKLTKEEWYSYFRGHWNFGGAKQKGHLAMFPEELPKRLIRMFSFVGDVVLDPFLGSGTTSLSAKNNSRNSVGYEINKEFISHIKQKLQVNKLGFFRTLFEFVEQNTIDMNFTEEIKSLPYIFKDYQDMDKKVDPKKFQYGSKIDNCSNNAVDYYSVKQVISPEVLLLNNDLKIRLIGVKEKKSSVREAIGFLELKTKNQKVFFKRDKVEYDENNNLFVYLYLKNKTFLNAHLVKRGLADVDVVRDYKYKNKLLSMGS
jgi:site-specific DNA-methyltransferase (adenine-specific)